MEDLRHLVEIYLAQAGLPPCDPDPLGFFVLPLTDECNLGVEWQAGHGEVLLFANPGCAVSRVEGVPAGHEPAAWQPFSGEDLDEEDDVEGDLEDEIFDLGIDGHGRWCLHIDGVTALATLCLYAPQRTLGPQEFAHVIDRFRNRFEVWTMALHTAPFDDPQQTSNLPPSAFPGHGLELLLRA